MRCLDTAKYRGSDRRILPLEPMREAWKRGVTSECSLPESISPAVKKFRATKAKPSSWLRNRIEFATVQRKRQGSSDERGESEKLEPE